jgi:L-lactate dehydrogenase complex protein LldF
MCADPAPQEHDAPEIPFSERYATALANERLSTNLTNFQQSWRQSRGDIMGEVDFETLRARMKAAKTEAIDNLDDHLATFVAHARDAGAVIHFASTADDATAIIRDIARQHDVKLVAKSKSMVSEEIELNHEFLHDGVEVVETDLGEWIVQLRKERPSHMVMPAIHLARQQVGEVFSERLGREISREDVSEQVAAAKDEIRDVFFAAGMGITGANALVAEAGTVMMVTNEGNGRLTSSIPPVHVVLAGIEKLVPTYDDAMTQLRLLARSATAQRLTVYSTFIHGPTPGHEMHIVLVDNGRRAMREKPEFREALHCIRCAACANVCPPYREVGGHVFGHIYSGAIGLVVTPFLNGLDAAAGPQSLCLSCNACETVCPVEIPLPRQILDVRAMVDDAFGIKQPKATILSLYARPKITSLGLKIARRAQRLAMQDRTLLRVRNAPVIRSQTRWRSMPLLATRPLSSRVKPGKVNLGHQAVVPNGLEGKRVALFPGCMTENLYPAQGDAIVHVMRDLGASVVYPEKLHCCGLPALNSGDVRHGTWMAKQTIKALEAVDADYIVSGSASCVATLTQDYLHVFRHHPAWHERAAAIGKKIIDFTSLLDEVAKLPEGSLAHVESRVIAYHDSCQGLNALDLRAAPRRILHDVLGHDVRDLRESRLCCGFGGSFSFEYPEISERLMTRKLNDIADTSAVEVVTDNQGCILQLRGGADAQGRTLQVRHLAELVAEGIDATRRSARDRG